MDGKEGARRREEEAGTARGEEERAASLSFFADHAAKQRGEVHASLISITPCFQRGHRQSNKEGLRGKILATCKAVASAKIRRSSSNNTEKRLSAPGNAQRRPGVTGNPSPLKAEEVLAAAAAASNKKGVRGEQIRSEGVRIPASNIQQSAVCVPTACVERGENRAEL